MAIKDTSPLTSEEKAAIANCIQSAIDVTARAARAAQEKGKNGVADAETREGVLLMNLKVRILNS